MTASVVHLNICYDVTCINVIIFTALCYKICYEIRFNIKEIYFLKTNNILRPSN